MSNSRETNLAMMISIAVLAVGVAAVGEFKTALHLDWGTGTITLVSLIFWGVSSAAAWNWSSEDRGRVLPIIIALLWVCLCPAFNYWKEQCATRFPGYLDPERAGSWWLSVPMEIETGIAILVVGYGLRYYLRSVRAW
ncbi:hypothetical protein ELE36_02525 [Pseudolysobacter antarcticus]|uniref:Uncharacterized protein n=1 Tax=Pseudolysobacter antarcticus TaxID=2511995 RepID=A0A411HFS2_9GAMM|nr:hypothetical protein [Pseudolysobacter antarcticus]QBB69338.1 hypothetical protein ELE36_02525 [Pseudolysobacter antarcticus]